MDKQNYPQHDSDKNYEHELKKKDNVDGSLIAPDPDPDSDPITRLQRINL